MIGIGIWFLSVVFGTYLGHGLYVQWQEQRLRTRWYHWEPDEKRTYLPRHENPVAYWWGMGAQTVLLLLCIYGAASHGHG